MAFVMKVTLLLALAYHTKAGLLSGHDDLDSYTSSALNAPSASYGPPSNTYGPPSTSYGAPAPVYGAPDSSGGLIADDFRNPLGNNLDNNGGTNFDDNRSNVIGTTVQVGRPVDSASRYELQSVVQNVIRRVPVEVIKHVKVAVPTPVEVPGEVIKVPVPHPVPVPYDVVKKVPYPVIKTQTVEVPRPVPYPVVKHVPFEVIKKVHVPVDKPYEVIKKIHVPVEKHVEVPVVSWEPYPIHIIKHVTHYKDKCKKCSW